MKVNRMLGRTIWSLLALIGLAAPLRAQIPAASFEELRTSMKLKEGEKIEVTEDNGTKYKARLNALSGHTLVITANGKPRDLTESQVREIRHRRPDKWWNGMLIGMGAGIGAGIVGVATTCSSNDSECKAIATAVLVPAFAGIGMGAGAAIDFAIKKHETVFVRSGVAAKSSVRISPILNKKTAGVSVALQF
jgi:hypothetical protein